MIGRAGRDNQPSTAVLLYSQQEAANKGLNPRMRDVVTSNTCQRVAVLRALDTEEVVEPTRECCTKCTGSEKDPTVSLCIVTGVGRALLRSVPMSTTKTKS